MAAKSIGENWQGLKRSLLERSTQRLAPYRFQNLPIVLIGSTDNYQIIIYFMLGIYDAEVSSLAILYAVSNST